MPLTLTLRQTSAIPLEVDAITLTAVRALDPDAVRRLPIQRGNRQVELGEFFDASGSAADNVLVWRGDCSRVKLIAAGHAEGTVRVEGPAGMHLAAEMSGGEVIVDGDAADWAGAEMKGGRLTIHGNAGHLVGAVYRGGRRGMTGGEIVIAGNAGNEVGHAMRRGLISIGGAAGDFIGVGMIAGTIIVGGAVGIRHGAGMKRGSIILLNPGPVEMLPTFRGASWDEPTLLRLVFQHARHIGARIPEAAGDARYCRYLGDFLELGKGEILFPAQGA